MANRILRDFTDSLHVDKLSMGAECFFVRLMMKADDFGSFHADARLLMAALFPLKGDKVTLKDVETWLSECQNSGLVFVYSSGGRNFVRIVNFNQRLRTMRNKFPKPSESEDLGNLKKLADNCQRPAVNCPPEDETRNEDETETKTKTKTSAANVKKFKIEDLVQQHTLDQDWIETAALALSREVLGVRDLLQKFKLHLGTQKCGEKTEKDFRDHFMNWARKQTKNVKTSAISKDPGNSSNRKFGQL